MANCTPTPARPERGKPKSIEERITRLEEQLETIKKELLIALDRQKELLIGLDRLDRATEAPK